MSSSLQASPQPNPAQLSSHSLHTPTQSRRGHSRSPSQNYQQNDNSDSVTSPLDTSQQFYTPSADPSTMNNPLEQTRLSPNPASTSTPTASVSASSPAPAPTSARNRPDLLGSPPIPPPRTSSNNRVRAATSNTPPTEGGSSRHGKRRDNGRRRGERDHPRERAKDDMSSPPVKSRRKAPHSPEGPQRAASTREPRDHASATPLESRSEAAMGPSSVPAGPVKEGSAIIKRMVVTNPDEDVNREQERQANVHHEIDAAMATVDGGVDGAEDDTQIAKSRLDASGAGSKKKETAFGEYVLGQTLGEGEFGKVRLGWKRDGSVQVAIKLIRRESLGSNPSRLPKIHREITILSGLSHPNIVRLHEMVQTDRHIGIILEYASGGELFDYILNHRYLKDQAARRLFAQLVSGVGYLHKKGIVHRDLKLENLLLDRNRNIIITDFGFANTFNPIDELSEEVEYNLTNREFVKQLRLDRVDASGMRRGDLMQTSCGSPCYAAPELVVSDSLYTGRKVDVWSCGVILYAMLAGYLPFDDDPANPDGDNINLLYKYIVTTPLTFPEYVTPHSRDLLRRILVPDPRKRADLFEVARHSWLAEFANVVSHITSNTTDVSEIANTTVPSEDQQDTTLLVRSASVREPPKVYSQAPPTSAGGSTTPQGAAQTEDNSRRQRDHRRTVQVEYVAPQSQTVRGDSVSAPKPSSSGHSAPTRSHSTAKPGSREARESLEASRSKPLPLQPNVGHDNRNQAVHTDLASRSHYTTRPKSRDVARSVSELTGAYAGTQGTHPPTTRPQTGGSMASAAGRLDNRMPSRGSYSQPVAPEVAATTVQGRLAQPKNDNAYNISAPIPLDPGHSAVSIGQPSTQPGTPGLPPDNTQKGHKRSSTMNSLGEKLFGRSGSIFGGRTSNPSSPRLKPGKRYPPTSMKDTYPSNDRRQSVDSRRSISYGFRKQSDASQSGRPRRFSLIPSSLSFKPFSSSSKDEPQPVESTAPQIEDFLRHSQDQQNLGDRRLSTAPANIPSGTSASNSRGQSAGHSGQQAGNYQGDHSFTHSQEPMDSMNYSAQIDRQFAALHGGTDGQYINGQSTSQPNPNNSSGRGGGYAPGSQQQGYHQQNQNFPGTYNHQNENGSHASVPTGRSSRNTGHYKPHRKFADAYEYEKTSSSGSSGAARKVMDFFRRRGKARAGEDR